MADLRVQIASTPGALSPTGEFATKLQTVVTGRCWTLETSARRIVGTDCGSSLVLPTPTTKQNQMCPSMQSRGVACRNMREAVMWPTPNVPNGGRTMSAEDVANKGATDKGKRQVGLENAVKFWPTPTVDDSSNATRSSGEFLSLTRSALSAGADAASRGAAIRQIFPTPRAQDSYERSNRKTIEAAHGGEAQMTLTREIKGANPWRPAITRLGRVAHGIPNRVHRLRCLGNAVVPQVVEVIGRAIMAAESGARP